MSQFTEKLPWVILFSIGGIVLSIGLSAGLNHVVPDALRQGLAFWVMMICLYPLMVYLSRQNKRRNVTPPKFRTHLLNATAGAVVVGLLTSLF
jgi:uncharacterized membrane protein YfcA